jgi:aspartyl-tRNA(Asn)/glutamyl-tRNA(Gln) amidotransferase subunit A
LVLQLMAVPSSILSQPITQLLRSLREGALTVTDLAHEVIDQAIRQAWTHTYLHLDEAALFQEAARLDKTRGSGAALPPLFGLPVSVKDIFDLRSQPTSAGSRFLPLRGRLALKDANWVAKWRKAGALLTGKTHLNEFAYGITGENPWWGPCLQPDQPQCLTGGSSSGAAASVQGGSACVGLGTDTGGSIRVPAAFSGLVGYRASHGSISPTGLFPLAPSFDTCGWVQRYLEDFPFLFSTLVSALPKKPTGAWRMGFWEGAWLEVCDPPIMAAYRDLARLLQKNGNSIHWLPSDGMGEASDIFPPMQAYEASRVHRQLLQRHRPEYDPAVRTRLEWGTTIPPSEYSRLKRKRIAFRQKIDLLWNSCDLLIAPACPRLRLSAQEDQTPHRTALLRLTTPFSLCKFPVLTFPWGRGDQKPGWQVIAPHGRDGRLALFASMLHKSLRLT